MITYSPLILIFINFSTLDNAFLAFWLVHSVSVISVIYVKVMLHETIRNDDF